MSVHTIKVKISEESDLFSSLDPDRKTVSEDLVGYLLRRFRIVDNLPTDKYVIQIISDTPVDEEKTTEDIREHIRQEKAIVSHELKKSLLKALCLTVFGLVILSICFFLSVSQEGVKIEVLDIIGWVSIWEATSILLMGQHELRDSKKNLNKILNAEFEYK